MSIFALLFRLLRFCDAQRYHLMDEIYKRALPNTFGECGRDVCIYYPFNISGAEFAEIGNNVHISRGAFIRAEGGLCIGDNVHIGRNLVIYTINHNYMGQVLPYDHTVIKKTVVIERNVWIGINVTIVPGVTIGEGAIVGAGSVVAKDIPRLAIIGSAPLRIIKFRDNDHYTKLDDAHRYGGVNGEFYKSDG